MRWRAISFGMAEQMLPTQIEPKERKSLEGSPSVGKIFGEIGLMLLVCLALPVAVALLMRLWALL
jgi:hypothetical protein